MTSTPPGFNTPDGKLNRARYYLRMAAQLCREASVPRAGELAEEAMKLVDFARIDDEEVSKRPTLRRLTPSKPPSNG